MKNILLTAITIFGLLPIAAQVPANYILKWSDEFETFNISNWSKGLVYDLDTTVHIIWNKTTGGSHLLNNNYCGYITDEDSYISNGSIYLRNQKRNYTGTSPAGTYSYTSGWVNSLRKVFFNGTEKSIYLEIKAKFPTGLKVWPAVWLVSESRVWPPEIDILEYFGKFFTTTKTDQMYFRYIYGHWTSPLNISTAIDNFHSTYDAEAWHVYGFQWTDNAMTWTIDGTEVNKIDSAQTNGNWPNENMCLILNNGVITVVADSATVWPNYLIIDYLRLYEYSPATSINISSVANLFSVYPNPANAQITIELHEAGGQKTEVGIYNISGQEIYKSQVLNLPAGRQGSKFQIDISNFPSGIYFVKLITDKTVEVRKIIKE